MQEQQARTVESKNEQSGVAPQVLDRLSAESKETSLESSKPNKSNLLSSGNEQDSTAPLEPKSLQQTRKTRSRSNTPLNSPSVRKSTRSSARNSPVPESSSPNGNKENDPERKKKGRKRKAEEESPGCNEVHQNGSDVMRTLITDDLFDCRCNCKSRVSPV